MLGKLGELNRDAKYYEKVNDIIADNKEVAYCLLAMDIEHFKMFNEWYGSEAGDAFLNDLADRIKEVEEKYATVAGYHGDDNFSILLPDDDVVIKEVQDSIIGFLMNRGNGAAGFLPIFGVYSIVDTTMSVSAMYDRAVIAMNTIKGHFLTRSCRFDDEMFHKMEMEHIIQMDALRAIEEEEFTFYLQPKCNMRTGKLVGSEALVRWNHKTKGMISPGVFIPALEKNGYIVEMDKYIWRLVYMWVSSLIERGIKPLPVSINVSRIDIFFMDVAQYLCMLSEKYDVSSSLIEVEITESAYMDDFNKIKDTVERLRAAGFRILMDDFGSGYSSLNMLKSVDVDILKIDMKFLDITKDVAERGIGILESVVDMARLMSIPTITEGVETKEQMDALMDMGCQYAQGYFFYRPMPYKDFEKLLTNEDALDYKGVRVRKVDQFHLREFLDENIFSDTMVNNILGAVAFFYEYDEGIEITRVNEQYHRLIACKGSKAEIVNNDILSHIPKEDWSIFKKLFEEAYNNRLNGGIGDVRYIRDDKTVLWMHLRVFFLNDKDGKRMYYASVADITNDKLMDEKLELLNRKLETTLSLEKVNSWEWNLQTGRFEMFNTDVKSSVATTLKDLTSKYVVIDNFPAGMVEKNVIPEKYLGLFQSFIKRIQNGKETEEINFEMPFGSSEDTIWLRIKGVTILDGNNKVVRAVGSYKDITERVAQRKESGQQLRMLEVLRATAIADMQANLTQGNVITIKNLDSWHEEFTKQDKTYDEFMAYAVENVVCQEYRERFAETVDRKRLLKLYDNKTGMVTLEYKRIVNGVPKWMRLVVYMSKMDESEDVFAYLMFNDIDEVKTLQQQLNNMTDVFTSINLGVIRYTYDTHKVIDVNDAALRILGYESREALEAEGFDTVTATVFDEDKEHILERMEELHNPGDYVAAEYRVKHSDGSVVHVLGNIQLLENERGERFYQRTFMDNTEAKTIEKEVIQEHSRKVVEEEAARMLGKVGSREDVATLLCISKIYATVLTYNLKTDDVNYIRKGDDLVLHARSNNFEVIMDEYTKKYVHKDELIEFVRATTKRHMKRYLVTDGASYSVRYRKKRALNEYVWYELTVIRSTSDGDGELESVVLTFREVE